MNHILNEFSKTALITTSTGQDAYFLATLLKQMRYKVFGLIGGSSKPHQVFDTILPFSFQDTGSLIRFLNENKIDEVYNLAAKSSVANSWSNSSHYFEINYHSVKRILEELAKSQIKEHIKFLQVGSTDMLGLSSIDFPIKIGKPWSPYGESKLLARHEVLKMRDLGVYCSSAIITNHDSNLRPPNFVIPTLARQVCEVIRKKRNFIELNNWNTTRDWAHAEDCVKAMQLMLQLPQPTELLIGTGVSMSLLSLASFISTRYEANFDIQISKRELRSSDLDQIYLDVSHTIETLNWTPTRIGAATIFSIIDCYLLNSSSHA